MTMPIFTYKCATCVILYENLIFFYQARVNNHCTKKTNNIKTFWKTFFSQICFLGFKHLLIILKIFVKDNYLMAKIILNNY